MLTNVADPATGCNQNLTQTQVVVVNQVPTATIAGTTTVWSRCCSVNITFTGANATPNYEFTYTLNGGASQTITTSGGNTASISLPTTTPGTYTYTLQSVEQVTSGCSLNRKTGTATVVINPMPNATSTGATTVCQGAPSPQVTFTGSNSSNNYQFTYTLNGGANQALTTTGGATTATINVPTNACSRYVYVCINQRS
ncbi:MAG: hypothetical protein R2779_10790 [Crocinitomicaceae bacterium]